jgi:hypothetical protein
LGIVVHDCRQAARSLSAVTGRPAVPPFVDEFEEVEVAGETVSFSLRLSFLDLGNLMLELLEPLDDRSPHALFLRRHGGGFHHLGFRVDNLSAYDSRFVSRGMIQIVNAARAPDTSHWVYYGRARDSAGVIELMKIGPESDALFDRVAKALEQAS